MSDTACPVCAREQAPDLWIYIGGEMGANETPFVVAYSLEAAMIRVLNAYTVPGPDSRAAGYPETWTCAFIDGETEDLLWRLDLPARDNDRAHALYIRKCDVQCDRRDPKTGWRE